MHNTKVDGVFRRLFCCHGNLLRLSMSATSTSTSIIGGISDGTITLPLGRFNRASKYYSLWKVLKLIGASWIETCENDVNFWLRIELESFQTFCTNTVKCRKP